MLKREDIVGKRITQILGDSSHSDESINYCDFIYVVGTHSFRMPFDDETGDLLPYAAVTANHGELNWPREKTLHFERNLWSAHIVDILVPADSEARYPNSGVIELSSGWYVVQSSSGSLGIAPNVDIIPDLWEAGPMVSVWALG